jgi:hypothetical protein
MTMNDGEPPMRIVNRQGDVTIESVGHTEVTDKRYRLTFPSFNLARQWAWQLITRYEKRHWRIQLVAYREWKEGPGGRELLGKYETKDTH